MAALTPAPLIRIQIEMRENSSQPGPGTRVFISYRRSDCAGHAGRLYDQLSEHFGEHNVFMDVDRIGPGADFVSVIKKSVISCDVLLAVIGRRWLSADGSTNRLADPDDFVRLEIVSALRQGIFIIPVLM